MEQYVIDMDDEGGHIYYLTNDRSLFEQAKHANSDEELWELLEREEHRFEKVYDLSGITVIEMTNGYFY
jgi:hypothetical protein